MAEEIQVRQAFLAALMLTGKRRADVREQVGQVQERVERLKEEVSVEMSRATTRWSV
jgi:hypothetical protein